MESTWKAGVRRTTHTHLCAPPENANGVSAFCPPIPDNLDPPPYPPRGAHLCAPPSGGAVLANQNQSRANQNHGRGTTCPPNTSRTRATPSAEARAYIAALRAQLTREAG